MPLSKPPVDNRNRESRSKLKPAVATATAVALGLSGVFLTATPASAAPGYSEAEGRFLSGTLLDASLDELAELAGERAEANSTTAEVVTESGDLDLSVLGGVLDLQVADGVSIPLTIADAGVVTQFAQASQTGASRGASGAVTDQGVIDLDGAAAAPDLLSFDLSDLISDELADSVANVTLEAGVVTATADQFATDAPVGDYNIAGLDAEITSPVVADLSTVVLDATDLLDGTVSDLLGPDGSLVGDLTGALSTLGVADVELAATVDLRAAVEETLEANAILGADGPVSVDLTTGNISVDIAALLEANGRDLNDLAPGEEILTTELVGFITAEVDSLLDGLLTEVQTTVDTVLDTTELTLTASVGPEVAPLLTLDLAGTLDAIATGETVPEISLLGIEFDTAALTTPITAAVSEVLDLELDVTAVDGLLDGLYPALDSVLTDLVSLQANVQETDAGTFTQTGLRLSVLNSGAPGELLSLNLAQAAVGPNAAETADFSFTPASGPEAGGTEVTLTGEDFVDVTDVLFGDTPAASFTVVSPEEIIAVTPAGVGSVAITVATEAGDLVSSEPFVYIPEGGPGDDAPVILGIAPSSGPEAGGTEVIITGTGFTGTETVAFGPTEATQYTVISDTEIVAVTPAGTGVVDLIVGNPAGSTVLEGAFSYIPAVVNPAAPVVDSVQPAEGPLEGGTVVTIGGENFSQGDTVFFGDNPATDVQIISDTEIRATTPAGASVGNVDVTVRSAAGEEGVLPNGFTYTEATSGGGVYYENCADAQAQGVGPIYEGDPGYRAGLDEDGDGVACEGNTSGSGTGTGSGSGTNGSGANGLAKTGGSVANGALLAALLSLVSGGLLLGFRRKFAS